MAQRPRPDYVSATLFRWIISAIVVGGVGLFGAGFGLLHSDLGDLHTDLKDIRGNVFTISGRLQDTKEDMLKASAAIGNQIAVTNTKLDDLIGRQPKLR